MAVNNAKQWVLQGDIDRFVDDGSLEDNVESFLSDDADPRDRVSRCADVSKGSMHMNFYYSITY